MRPTGGEKRSKKKKEAQWCGPVAVFLLVVVVVTVTPVPH